MRAKIIDKMESKLTGYQLLEGTKHLFAETYLTMLSIIQGVTLHLLLSNSMKFWNKMEHAEYGYEFIIYSILSLAILILIWYEYLYSLQFPRISNWKDTVFPILLGVFQIILSYETISPKYWILFTIPLGIFGYFAYKNTRKSLKPERKYYKDYIVAYIENLQKKKEAGMLITIFLSLIFLVLYIIFPQGVVRITMNINILDVLYFLLILYFIIINFLISKRIYSDFKELDKNYKYEPERMKEDILYLEPAMACISRKLIK